MFNPIGLIEYIKDKIQEHFKISNKNENSLTGLRILDIGCGGGLISEPGKIRSRSNRYRCITKYYNG